MATTRSIEPKSTVYSPLTWQSFKLTKSIRRLNAIEYDFHLLKDNETSFIGDFRICTGDKEYTLDRVILASKSNFLMNLMLSSKIENRNVDEIDYIIPEDSSLGHLIIDIIYGKDVKCVINEDNFVQLIDNMRFIEIEIDLEIFKQFIEEIIKPKAQLNIHMFDLLDFLLMNSPNFNYLLPIASQYFSDRLLEIYEKKEFLYLSAERFISVLLSKSDNHLEKSLVGRVCAKWICHEYQNRIEKLKDLVNATKYRYGLLPYCHCDLTMKIKSLHKNHSCNEPDVTLIEKYFNELLFSSGEAKFDTPSELTDKLNSMRSGDRVVFPTDPIIQWVSFLDKEIFCDVAVIVQGSTFKLHRIKLSSVSGYFYDLFTNPTESVASEVDRSDDELKIRTLVLDRINPETFLSVVQYIYRQEIEVTSKNHLISLLRASKFLKMYDLFENCSLRLLNMTEHDFSFDIIEIFQYVCENGKYSELYNMAVKSIVSLWPKLGENLQFLEISLDVFTEIVAQPHLQIDNTDQVLDLCSKWIFHDIQNRYKYTIEVARAINRNYMMDTEHLKLEIPQNLIDFSQQYVKEQLIRILSSIVLVPAKTKNVQRAELNPCFLMLNKNDSLCVLDANLNEIIQLPGVRQKEGFQSSATVMDNELFILFRNHNSEFYFQLYHISSKRLISLIPDARMNSCKNFVILSCNDEVYFCGDKVLLKYSVELNRWISFLKDEEGDKQYTSDGAKLYKIFSNYDQETNEWENKTSYYDFEQNGWIALPNIPIKTESIATPDKLNTIKGELSVLSMAETLSFSWVTQRWSSVPNYCENFVEFTADRQNILYVSDDNNVFLYSPVRKEWILQKHLDSVGLVKTIHKIDK